MNRYLLILLWAFYSTAVAQKLPVVVAGEVKRFENFPSKYVTARNVDVWLPANYKSSSQYAVLYMHDGQALFDSTTTWNKQAWDVDDVISKLLSGGKIENVIVVGIWNGGATRHSDYFPQKPYERLSGTEQDTISARLQRMGRTKEKFKPQSDNYLRFIVKELKPFIDKQFSTYTDSQHTFIAGSSMGGLISFYAICEYPRVFGGAACLSTHWPGIFSLEDNPIPEAFLSYAKSHLPKPRKHKIYFDYGDQTLDALYPPLQKRMDVVMVEKGFTAQSWSTRFFPGENHSERAWHKRLAIPLLFLLNKE